MKLRHAIPIAIIFTCSQIQAFSQDNQTLSEKCVSIIPKDSVEKYARQYHEVYNRVFNKKRTKKIVYPKDYFLLFDNFLVDNENFDGIRFVFGAFNKRINRKDQAHKKQIIVMAAPSREKKEVWNEFIKYNQTKNIITDATPGVKLFNKNDQTRRASRLSHDLFILLDSSNGKKYKTNYKEEYKDSSYYSCSLFLCSENFFRIKKFMDDPLGKNIDGVILQFSNYGYKKPETKQAGPNQISLTLTPSINGIPQFESFQKFLTLNYPNTQKYFNNQSIMSLNHGELCPHSCK